MEALPSAVDAPSSEVIVDGLPRWEVVGEEAPSATATHDVEDSGEDLTQGVHPRASGSSGSGKMGLYADPLGVGEVGLWYALLIMPGILPGHRFRTPFQTVSKGRGAGELRAGRGREPTFEERLKSKGQESDGQKSGAS
jgi:hypothetical protein